MRVLTHPQTGYRIYAPVAGTRGYLEDWNRFLDRLLFGLDVETTGLEHDSVLRLIQVASLTEAWVFDVTDPYQVGLVTQLFQSPWRRFVSHTSIDPRTIARCLDVDISQRSLDTWVNACLEEPGDVKTHALKPLTAARLDPYLQQASDALDARFQELKGPKPPKPKKPTPTKSTRPELQAKSLMREDAYKAALAVWEREVAEWESFNGWRDISVDDPVYLMYSGLDAIYALRLFRYQLQRLQDMGLSPGTITDAQRFYQICTAMSIDGMTADPTYARTVALGSHERTYEESRTEFEALTGFVSGSPKLGPYLEDRGMILEELTEAGQKAKDAGEEGPFTKALGKVILEGVLTDYLLTPNPDPAAVRAMELKEAIAGAQNYVTFTRNVLERLDAQNRIHPVFKTLGAVTGRMSAVDPPVQTVKGAVTRGIIIARSPSEVLCSIDLSQIEPRIMAAEARETTLIELLEAGVDIYDAAATLIWSAAFTKVQRSAIKRVILATAYGGGIKVIRNQLRLLDGILMSEAEITDVRDDWRRIAPGVARLARRMATPNDVWLPSGRFVPYDPQRLYKNVNSLIQGAARDVLQDCVFRSQEAGYGRNLVNLIHDEGIFSLPRLDLDKHLATLVDCWTVPYKGVPVKCEVEIYDERWGHDTQIWASAA